MSSGPINCEPVAKSVPDYAVSSRITYITGCKPHLVMILLLFGSPSPGAGSAGMALTFKGIEPIVSVHEPRPLCPAISPSHVVSAASSRKSFPVRVPLLSIACHVRRFPMSIRPGVAHKYSWRLISQSYVPTASSVVDCGIPWRCSGCSSCCWQAPRRLSLLSTTFWNDFLVVRCGCPTPLLLPAAESTLTTNHSYNVSSLPWSTRHARPLI